MNDNDFKILAHTYGANLDRWPEGSRHEAARIAKANPELLQDATQLDKALDSFTIRDADPQLLGKIIAKIEKETDKSPILIILHRGSWMRGVAFISLGILGLFLGSVNMEGSQNFSDNSVDSNQDIFNSTSSTIIDEVMP